ncbi:MAG: hypothetical protein EOO47_03670 [Flavobacterium sp.]|nr:MAG: hypothetical protein EOO47_03670 [Flavobacterium sp.]
MMENTKLTEEGANNQETTKALLERSNLLKEKSKVTSEKLNTLKVETDAFLKPDDENLSNS